MALTYPIAVDEATKALTEEAFELLHDRKNNAHKQEYLIALIPDICLEARNQDDDDDTLLMTAVDKKNRARFVKALIRAGADIETRNKYGRTPLYWRTRVGLHDAVVDALINKGANIYVKNKYDVEINIDALTAEYPLSHWQENYAGFVANRTAPESVETVYELLCVTPLIDPKAPIDRNAHLRQIFLHAKWEPKNNPRAIIDQLRADGTISCALGESLLALTRPARMSAFVQHGRGR